MYPRGVYYLFRREFMNTTFLNTGIQQEADVIQERRCII